MRTPEQTYQAMLQELHPGIANAFPVAAGKNTLHLVELHPGEMPAADDWNGQKAAVLNNRTWGVPLKATMALKDASGKVIDKKQVRLGLLPTPTNRSTFIVDGREYQVSHQRRLRPGIYTKRNRLGDPVADFNLSKGRNFSVVLDPKDNRFQFKLANTHVPLQPVLKHVFDEHSLGLDKRFEHAYTPEEEHSALRTLFAETHLNQPIPERADDLKGKLREYFAGTRMDAAISKMTVGAPHELVDADALKDAARHVLAIQRKEREPSYKDQMAFTEVHGVEDFLRERMEKGRFLIGSKIKQKLDRVSKIDDLNLHAAFQPAIHSFFTSSSLASTPVQVNPLEMAENAYKITSMGDGGIGDSNAIPAEVRNIHPSSAGFIDPVRTPDNAKAGVDVRTAIGTTKVGKQLVREVLDAKTGARVKMSPQDLYDRVVAHDKEPTEHGLVRAIRRGQIVDVRPEQVEFKIPTEEQFTVSTAIVPFIPNSHAHRVAMGAKMLGQALSLVDREVPLVDTLHSNLAVKGLLPVAPVSGRITKVEAGVVHIKGDDGKTHAVNYAHEFPLNGGSYLHTELGVAVGDRVRAGARLGDTNFTHQGQLALGKNLNVAYLPFKGHNYEDGFVVSETGARKLTSNHLHTEEIEIDERTVNDLSKFKSHFPGKYEANKLSTLDEHGVVKVGTVLKEGDPIMAMLRKRVQDPETLILGKAHKSLLEPFRDASSEWTRPYEGKVTAVSKSGSHVKLTITSQAPAMVGDKIAGRFGNKGVIAAIVPDHEVPHTKDGRIPDVMINSAGLVSRMNNGQIFEVSVGKALQAKGIKTQKFEQFMGGNTHQAVTKLVRESGIQESEIMYDPKTGKPLKDPVLFGPQYFLKLFKQAETGFSARSGGKYDIDLRPAKGGEEGSKSVGYLDLFGFLSHGANNLLRENATYKAEYNPEVLAAMWRGAPLPPPKPTFAFQKFETMLRGMGVNVKKDGHKMTLLPMTDKDVLGLSSGAVSKPLTVSAKEDVHTGLPFRPEEGGLFDHNLTGGLVGNRWSHIALHEPVVNPLFHKPVRTLLGMKKDEFETAIATEGGLGIEKRLKGLDVDRRLGELKTQIRTTNAASKKDGLYKQVKYLSALKAGGLAPHEAYVLRNVPVIPPNMRPMYPDAETGKIVQADANKLYQNLMLVNEQLAQHKGSGDPGMVQSLRTALHDHVAKVQGLDGNLEGQQGEKEAKGFLKIITGNRAKDGFFQSKLISRRQDVAGRGVVVPNPGLGIDDIGLPAPMGWKLYRNHAVGELVRAGMPLDQAAKEFEEQSELAHKALMTSMQNYPVIMTRAPSLHKFNLQAFKPHLVAGKSIEVNTLIHKGFNMDHDGDSCVGEVMLVLDLSSESLKKSILKHIIEPSNSGAMEDSAMPFKSATVADSGLVHVVCDLKDFPRDEATKSVKENGNEFYQVPAGVFVYAYDPEDGRIRLFPVTEYSVHKNLDLVKVAVRSGRTAECSTDHSLYAINPQTLAVSKVRPADALGWMVPRPRKVRVEEAISRLPMGAQYNKIGGKGSHNRHDIADWLHLDYEAGYFLGAMVGDGYAASEEGRLGLCNVSQEMFDRVKDFLIDRVCSRLSFSEHDNAHEFDGHDCFSRKLHWSSVSLNAFVAEQIGQGAENKHLPSAFLRTPEDFRWGLLAGLLDTDGKLLSTKAMEGKKINWHAGYDSKSEQLCQEILTLCMTLGVRASMRDYKNKKGETYWQVTLSVTDVRECANKIKLSTPQKVEALGAMVEAGEERNLSRGDAIPIPRELALALRQAFGAPRNADGRRKSLYVLIHKATRSGSMNRETAKEVINRISYERVAQMDLGQRWMEIVYTDETLWDEVVKIEKSDSGVTAYDLTVPDTWTFMLANGLVVQDTTNIHIPVTPDGAKDAFRMLPSNNLFSPLNRSPVHVPTQEVIMGLWKVTNLPAGTKPVKRFSTKAEALAAHKRGDISLSDPIEVAGV